MKTLRTKQIGKSKVSILKDYVKSEYKVSLLKEDKEVNSITFTCFDNAIALYNETLQGGKRI